MVDKYPLTVYIEYRKGVFMSEERNCCPAAGTETEGTLNFLSFSHSNSFLRATGVSGRSFLRSYIHP